MRTSRYKWPTNSSTPSGTARQDELTDEQWALVAPLIPTPPARSNGRGRPWRDTREVLNGVLCVLRSNARWKDLPECFPSYQTCHRRFQQWMRDGTLRRILEMLEEDLRVRGQLDVSEYSINEMSLMVKEQGASKGTSEATVQSSWQQQTATIFISPMTRKLLRRLQSPLAQRLSLKF
jgi:transposase